MANWFDKLKGRFLEAPVIRNIKAAIVKKVGFAFVRDGGGRSNFEFSPYDFREISMAYNTDGFVRQALDKYVELMFKSGWTLTGRNDNAVEYARQRLRVFAHTTSIPTEQLFMEIAEDLVKYGNAFVVKSRREPSEPISIPGLNISGIGDLDPVTGYFTLPADTISISRDRHGNILSYQQEVPGQDKPLTIRPEDMIHVYYKKERGYAFGSPFIGPVIDDVRLLRDVEENVTRLIHRHLHPLYSYTVGIPQAGYEATQPEIEAVRREIENMPTDGGLVLPERHKVEAIGASGEALDVSSYLHYFEQRVFTGLGLPETVMGRGDTSNRGTSDNLSAEARDRIKSFQRIQEIFINAFVINEILMEGGFDPLSNEADEVRFKFEEIDIDNKIKSENHTIQLWTNDLITHDEARGRIGEDPLDSDLSETHSRLVSTYSDDAGEDNKSRPENQHGKKTGPKKSDGGDNDTVKNAPDKKDLTINENMQDFKERVSNIRISETYRERLYRELNIQNYTSQLQYHYDLTKKDVLDKVKFSYVNDINKEPGEFDKQELGLIFYLTKDSLSKVISKYTRPAIYEGIARCKYDCGVSREPPINIESIVSTVHRNSKEDISKMLDDVAEMVVSKVTSSPKDDVLNKVVGVFAAMEYRLNFIARSQTMRAYNYAYASAAKGLGRTQVVSVTEDDSCMQCKNLATKPINLSGDLYKAVPPWHVNCWCHLEAE